MFQHPEASLHDFGKNKQNTHGQYLNQSVGALLLILKKRFLPQNSEVAKGFIEKEIQLFEAYVKNHFARFGLKDAHEWTELLEIFHQMIEQPLDTDLDMIQFSLLENSPRLAFPLKEVYGLVCFALGCKEVYPQDQQDEESQLHRLLSLVSGIRSIVSNPVCHTGIRNQLVMTLNHVYPHVEIIEDLRAFLTSVVQNVFEEKFLEMRANEGVMKFYRAVSVSITKGYEDHFLDPIHQQLQETLPEKCRESLINPEEPEVRQFIDETCSNLKYFPVPLSDDLTLHAILTLHLANPNWADFLTTCEYTDIFQNYIQVLAELVRLKEDILKYHGILSCCNAAYQNLADKEMPLFLEYIDKHIQQVNPLLEEPPSEISSFRTLFKSALKQYLNDSQEIFISDFFALWQAADFFSKRGLLARILVLYGEGKITLDDENIQRLIRYYGEGEEITPNGLNRVLLHAFFVPMRRWTDYFRSQFNRVVALIEEQLALQGRNPIYEDSYKFLMPMLRAMKNCNPAEIPDQNFPPISPFRILTDKVIQNVDDFSTVLKAMSESQRVECIKVGGPLHYCKLNLIRDATDLAVVLRAMSKSQRVECLKEGGILHGKLALIENAEDLADFFKAMPESQRVDCLMEIGIFYNKFIFIRSTNNLIVFLRAISKSQRVECIKDGGPFHCKLELIRSATGLAGVLHAMPESQRVECLREGGVLHDKLALIKNGKDLAVVLRAMPESQRLECLKEGGLFHDKLILIESAAGLAVVLRAMPESQRVECLKEGGLFHNKLILIESAADLAVVLRAMPESQRVECLREGGLLHDKLGLIRNVFDLVAFLKVGTEFQNLEYLKEGGVLHDKLVLIESISGLIYVLKSIPKLQKVKCFKKGEFLHSRLVLIQSASDLAAILVVIPRAAIGTLITEGRFFDGKLNLTQYCTELIESLRAYEGNSVAYCVFAIHESRPISIKNLSDFLKAFQALTNNERLEILLTGPLMCEWLVLKESLEAFIEFADVSFRNKVYILDRYLISLANRRYYEIYEIMDYIERNFRENGTLSKDDIRRISDCISSKNRPDFFGSYNQKVLEILDILTKFLNKNPPSYEPESTRLPMIK